MNQQAENKIPAAAPLRAHPFPDVFPALWDWLSTAPLMVKITGLVVFPLALTAAAEFLFLSRRLPALPPILPAGPAATLPQALLRGGMIFGLSALVGVGFSLILTSLIVRPLRELRQAMQRAQTGDFSVRVDSWAHDEIGDVQAAFNEMAAELGESQKELNEKHAELEALNAENSLLAQNLEEKNRSLHELYQRTLTIQEQERQHLARELHDETSQELTAMLLQIKSLEDEQDLELIQQRLGGLRSLTAQTLDELHRLVMDLRPTVLDDLGLVAALRWLAQECTQRSGIVCSTAAQGEVGILPADLETTVYRIAQEALTNIMRHSQAVHAWLCLEVTEGNIRLVISDDGCGFDPARPSTGFGLSGMRERATLAGGNLHLESVFAQGTRISLEVPRRGAPT